MSSRKEDLLDEFLKELAAENPEAADELTQLVDELAPATVSGDGRSRLLANLPSSRFERFAADVAKLLDIDEATAQTLLDGIDRGENWVPGLFPGMDLYHVDGGPTVERAITGFVRLGAGAQFPEHGHVGDEYVLILQGYYTDDVSGKEYGPGDIAHLPGGTSHSFRVLAESTGLLYLAVIQEGMEIGGEVIDYNDPRL
jgi:putative transcriptional regulator